jgi:ATP-dependent Clp protease ATP-binding subunit ClpA
VEQDKLSVMEEELRKRVIGQDEAIEKVSQIIKMARAGLKEPKRPTGVFLFLGPTGVGKTELAKATAEFLFGSEDEMIRFDMSEFMEKHSVAKLIGAPPGYIGYEEEGQLTGRLRTQPHTVVLFDEIEKAHPEVLDILLQLFDEGRLTDAKGRTVDAKNAIFIMTSNIGSEIYQKKLSVGFVAKEEEREQQELLSHLKKTLRAEFLNRIDEIIVFKHLEIECVIKIASLMFERLRIRLKEQDIILDIRNSAVEFVAREGFDSNYGARFLLRTIENLISRPLSTMIINKEIKKGDKVRISVSNKKIKFNIIKGG